MFKPVKFTVLRKSFKDIRSRKFFITHWSLAGLIKTGHALYERPDEAVSLQQTEGLVLVAGRAERVLLLLLMGQMWLVGGGMR